MFSKKSVNNSYSTSSISFSQYAQGWNEQTGQGCIIENAVLSSVVLSIGASVKLSSVDSDRGFWSYGSSLIITNSRINITDGLSVSNGAVITNNVFVGNGYGQGIYGSGNVTLSGNKISKCNVGVNVYSGNWVISDNTISECGTGIKLNSNAQATIQRNLINNNTQNGIDGGNAVIESNTITNNRIGISNPLGGASIHNNNIVGNTVNSVTVTTPDVDASNNWWGTTDLAAINQTIYDHADDPQWGKLNFLPIFALRLAQVRLLFRRF